MQLLLKHNANDRQHDFQGDQPIHSAGLRGSLGVMSVALSDGDRDPALYLNDKRGARGRTVLHDATHHSTKNSKTALFILEEFPEIGRRMALHGDKDNHLPLHYASHSGNARVVR